MNKALWVAKTGLEAQQTRMSVISNNLANVNTTGFKRDRAVFEDLLYQNVRQVGAQSSQDTRLPSGLQLGTGVRTVATEKIQTLGNIVQTENSLDVAIQGRGFFQVLKPDGNIGYSRDGSFKMDETGQLVTASGYVLQPAITVPNNSTSLTIGSDGVVSSLTPGKKFDFTTTTNGSKRAMVPIGMYERVFPFESPDDEDGHMYYVGARYNFPNDKTKIGVEFNHGSKYWFNFALAEDDAVGQPRRRQPRQVGRKLRPPSGAVVQQRGGACPIPAAL